MKKHLTYFTVSIIITTIIVLAYFSNRNKPYRNPYMLIVYSSFEQDSSIITIINKEGKSIFNKNIDIGGVYRIFKDEDNIYIPLTGTYKGLENKIAILNLTNHKLKLIDTNREPIWLGIGEDIIASLGRGSSGNGTVVFFDKNNYNRLGEVKLSGVLKTALIHEGKTYVCSDIVQENKQKLYIIDNNKFSIDKEIDTGHGSFANDMLLVNKKLLIADVANQNISGEGKEMLIYDITNSKTENVVLPNFNPSQLHKINNELLVTHYNPMKNTGHTISILDINKLSMISSYELDGTLFRTRFSGENLFVMYNNTIDIYKHNQYHNKNSITLPSFENERPRDFIVLE